mmetsp:Transcript_15992/g.44227  ORF Transcript_15992/g.44227 Transcript_15992/m.44227 type:complete len:609 (-) Transcript_15992:496-2322(-)
MGCSQSSISSVPVEEAAVPKNIPKSNQPNPSVGDKKESSQNSGDTSSCNTKQNLLRWKEDLSRCGDLTKAVVRIETSATKRVEDVYDGIHNGLELGEGAAGVVRKCTHRETGIDFAAKCLNIGLIESEAIIQALREEVFIMCQADHPDIIRLEEVYESDEQIYLIMDLLKGGDMFDRLEDQPNYSEADCSHMVKQMLSAIKYLHANNIVHRDLKLENFLFDDKESISVQLIDFGLSKHFDPDGCNLNDAVGTPYTVAPEIIRGEYNEKVDVWAIGVITYLLLCGDSPFGGLDGEAMTTVRQNILNCNLVFEPREIWDSVSDSAKDFVRCLLTKDPQQRPSAAEAANHEWFVESACANNEQRKPLNDQLVKNLVAFKEYSNLQQVLLEVVSFTLVPEQIKELKQDFEAIDTDGTGTINLDELKKVMLNRVVGNKSLTEDNVEMVFNSLHLQGKQASIRWHKFITAGLSRCDYDDRNLKLAFNRLDGDGKGYITVCDLQDMISSKQGDRDEEVCAMWKEGMESFGCLDKDRITFDDFRWFLAGHHRRWLEREDSQSSSSSQSSLVLSRRLSSARVLSATLGLEEGGSQSFRISQSSRSIERCSLKRKCTV